LVKPYSEALQQKDQKKAAAFLVSLRKSGLILDFGE
jgi:hypothetical protein